MTSALLTTIERAGGAVILPRSASYAEREALALHLGALKAQGHAVIADEVIENGEASGDLRVWHYTTCRACKGAIYGRQIPAAQG